MALGITAVVTDDFNSPYVTITVTGITVGPNPWTVTRIDNTGETATVAVRGMDTVDATSTTGAGVDYEAPIGNSVKYRVTQNAATADSTNVTVAYQNVGDCWLRSVDNQTLSRRVAMSEFSETSYPTRILSNVNVLGRQKPIIITDAWGGRTGSLVIVTDNDDGLMTTTWQDIVALVTGGGTMFLQTVGRTETGQDDMYFEINSYSRTRMGPIKSDGLGKNVYQHNIEFTEVDRPSTLQTTIGLRNYTSVLNEAASVKVQDTFTRSGTDTWSTADFGGSWSTPNNGVAGDYDVSGTEATIQQSTAAVLRHGVIDIGNTDFDITVSGKINQGSATTASLTQWVMGRWADVSNWYAARIEVTTGGVVNLRIYKFVAAVETALGAAAVQIYTGHLANDKVWVRFKGDGTSLKAMAWKDGASVPTDFQIFITDASLTGGTKIGLGARRETGNTNAVQASFDDLSVTDSASYQDIINHYTTYLTLLTTSYPPGG